MQSKFPLIALSLLCIGSLHAESETIQIPEGKLNNHASLFGDITPSAGPRVINGYGVFLTGDYLYWTANEDNLEFAVSGANINNASTLSVDVLPTKTGKTYEPHFRFHSGFKAGIGFDFGHDKWDMYINYTWFNSHSNSKSAIRNGFEPLVNLVPVGSATPYALLNAATMKWKLNYFNVFDVELGRNMYISKFLSLRPFFGVKGTWQKQTYKLNYQFTDVPTINSENKNSFWGVGLLAGVNTTWHLAGTWSLFADLALSSLWGVFHVKREDENPFTETSYYNSKKSFHSIKPVIELGAGIRKEQWFNKDRFHLAVQAGWEQQVWFSQNQFDFYTAPREGDLTLQGFTGKVRFDF